MDSYKRAMDKITADDEFRSELLNKLKTEQKTVRHHHSQPKKIYPIAAAVASAAVLLFTISFSRAYLLPLLRYNSYDGADAEANKQIVLLPWLDNNTDKSDNNSVTDAPDTDKIITGGSSDVTGETYEKNNVSDKNSDENKEQTQSVTDLINEPFDEFSDFIEPPSTNAYKIVSFPGYDKQDVAKTDSTVTYDMTVHFRFIGFTEYDVGLYRSDMLFCETLENNYTLYDFFNDYSYAIVGGISDTTIDEGILQSFLGITADDDKQLQVYVDNIEVLNLKTYPLSQFKDMTDVYLTVSVV